MAAKQFSVLPQHLGIIMDGNGRWAKQRGLARSEGHKQGSETFRKIGEYAGNLGIRYITFYAFSTENWNRPETEVNAIMNLFDSFLTEAIDRLDENIEKGIRLHFLGDKSGLPDELRSLMDFVEEQTKHCNKVHLNLAINYGGRQEILQAVRAIAKQVKLGNLNAEQIDEALIADHLYTAGQPDPDLIIRPSGELRLSNFLTYQSAYSEFWFSDVLWPDFTEEHLNQALSDYEKRHRRFGGI
ncbi:MAG: isoprenyl transferase [Clostridia bacterium]|nr:isoprenyl transferase [Clostridia bacterium]MBR2414088.1 isoprenyl transferase [Clostridia bacterium]MBR3955242.1 isoprenyl transferase [Clostridia bacterium]